MLENYSRLLALESTIYAVPNMIQKLTPDLIESTARLHREVLVGTLNSRAGLWFVKRLYAGMVSFSDNGYCFVAVENTSVVGFISFGLDRSKLDAQIMASLGSAEKVRVGLSLVFRPWLLPALIRQRLFSRYLRTKVRPGPFILTLGVSPIMQGHGVGKRLVDWAKDEVRSAGFTELFVDTEVENTGAVAFYKKIGFQYVATVQGNIILSCPLKK